MTSDTGLIEQGATDSAFNHTIDEGQAMAIAHGRTLDTQAVSAALRALATGEHMLVVGCRGDCDYDPDFVAVDSAGVEHPETGLCTCGIYGWELRLVCPHVAAREVDGADGKFAPIASWCANHEPCGCEPTTLGPRTADGELSDIVINLSSNALIPYPIPEYEFADYWASDIQPVCPRTGLHHSCWEGQLFTPTHECFGVLSVEHDDSESLDPLSLEAPGIYGVTWTYAGEGYAQWRRTEAHQGAAQTAQTAGSS